MANSFRQDTSGAAFVEFTVVFPMLMLFLLGTVDVTMLMVNWASYNRATYAGARFAAISNPVAPGINAAISGTKAGQNCINSTTGAASGNCTARSATTCIASGAVTGGSCTNGYTWSTASDTALDAIVTAMRQLLLVGTLDRRQVSVTYTPTNVGYVMRTGGPPLNITVSIRCAQFQFIFLQPLMGWAFPAPPTACRGITIPNGVTLPPFSTTLPSEDLTTN